MLSFAEVVFQSTLRHRFRVDVARADWSRAVRDLHEWEQSAGQLVTAPGRDFHERALAESFAALAAVAPAAVLEAALPPGPAERGRLWLLAGRAEYAALQFASAEAHFRAAIAAAADNADAHLWAGRAAIRQGAGCRAAADFGRARALGATLAPQETAIADAKSCE
jgi:tetratricopeptide (TPR) repeat protein